jgi:glyoxylase-like metal-dependent hydrolase (beta-lactamase superfamily II)
MKNPLLSALCFSPLLMIACSGSQAQDADRFAKVEIKTEKLADGVAVLFGSGGNIGVSHGPDGTVLIDDQFAPLTEKIQAAVAALGAEPVKFLINTHWHFDHSGGNENFGKAGALIVAHDNVRIRMAKGVENLLGNSIAPAPKVALPVVTYDDGLKLHLNGDTVHVIHVEHGHTDGDSIIIWEKANIIHMGDLFFNKVTLPFVDLSSGGNVTGLLHAVDEALARANDQTRIIPGHGPVASRDDLLAYRNMLMTVIERVKAAMAQGKDLATVIAMKPAAEYEVADAFITGDRFTEAVFKSLQAVDEMKHP